MTFIQNKCNSREYAKYYSKMGINATQMLAFRDLEKYIEKLSLYNGEFLDFGCGAGKSTRFLEQFSSNITAVDINNRMINQAKKQNSISNYISLSGGTLPFVDNKFDLVFSSWVLMEFSSIQEMQKSMNEISRVLKIGGYSINIVCNKNAYSYDWVSLRTDFAENKNLFSGCEVRVNFPNIDLTIKDYYWEEKDYEQVFSNAKMTLLEKYYPKGRKQDQIEWKDEIQHSPYTIYILKRKTAP